MSNSDSIGIGSGSHGSPISVGSSPEIIGFGAAYAGSVFGVIHTRSVFGASSYSWWPLPSGSSGLSAA